MTSVSLAKAPLSPSSSPNQEEIVTRVLNEIEARGSEYIDFRFTDTLGVWHHMTFHKSAVNKDFLIGGIMFDGSSIKGWKRIEDSDMMLVPANTRLFTDPFAMHSTLIVICDVHEPSTNASYGRDPRATALAAENYLRLSGIADTVYLGPEPEFFVFDEVYYKVDSQGSYYAIDSEEGSYPEGPFFSGFDMRNRSTGHRPSSGQGYFPVAPVDQGSDLRTEMIQRLNEIGLKAEKCHHEVAVSQHEIGFRYGTLTETADNLQAFKYIVKNVAHEHGKTVTFMPKPVFGDNGSGMHVHMSLSKEGEPVFLGDQYNNLSQEALYFIGGILKNARSINAFTNPTTNSYKRLVPGFEAPIFKAYSARNRSAAIRIPHVTDPKSKRIEVRFPDPTANAYLALSAMLMAGLDGIENKIDPGAAMEKNLFHMDESLINKDDLLCTSLLEALRELDANRAFLKKGGVFSDDQIDSYINLRQEEARQVSQAPHPMEFQLYYSS